ncbi:MAG: cyclic nucleotide-binding domain-containing protein [Rhodobacteraceae bacterium]|nr:cyclic nucleotide-binding domain-containing protein [Paracoccaceae bacterium]
MITIMSGPLFAFLSSLRQRERCLSQGAFLFHQGDAVSKLFIVTEGGVELVRHQEDGSAVILQRAAEGAVVAEASVFSEAYHCDAVASAPARVVSMPMREVRRLFISSPEFAEAWARHLTAEVRRARLRSEILTLRTVSERLNAWLAGQGQELPPKGEWKSVARQIGVSPEALYRELARRRAG